MDFTLTDEQEELRDLASTILGERATVERVTEVEASEERFDRTLWVELAKAGLLGVAVPEEHGGLGFSLVELAVVCEQLGRVVAPVPLVWTAVAALAVAEHGTDAQRTAWLPGVPTGDTVLTLALPQSALGVGVTDGRISGQLLGVSYAHVADRVLVPVNDAVYLVCLVVVGCPVELAAALGFGFFFLEYLRARAGNAGGDEVGRVTVAERPTRVILLSASIHFSGVFLGLSDVLPVAGPAVLLALTVLSIGQLAVTVRRQLLAVPLDAPGA